MGWQGGRGWRGDVEGATSKDALTPGVVNRRQNTITPPSPAVATALATWQHPFIFSPCSMRPPSPPRRCHQGDFSPCLCCLPFRPTHFNLPSRPWNPSPSSLFLPTPPPLPNANRVPTPPHPFAPPTHPPACPVPPSLPRTPPPQGIYSPSKIDSDQVRTYEVQITNLSSNLASECYMFYDAFVTSYIHIYTHIYICT